MSETESEALLLLHWTSISPSVVVVPCFPSGESPSPLLWVELTVLPVQSHSTQDSQGFYDWFSGGAHDLNWANQSETHNLVEKASF